MRLSAHLSISLVISLAIPLGVSATAFARGGGVGTFGGGNAVVCYDSPARREIRSLELFDYWEQSQRLGMKLTLSLGSPSLSVQDKIAIAVARLSRLDVVRGRRVAEKAAEFLAKLDQELTDDPGDLTEVKDDRPLLLPSAPCYKVQFAVQSSVVGGPYPLPPETPLARALSIRRALFNSPMTSNDVRAGLILHEAIYNEMLEHGSNFGADEVRYLNYLLATSFFVSTDPNLSANADVYLDFCRNIGLQEGEYLVPKVTPEDLDPLYADWIADSTMYDPGSVEWKVMALPYYMKAPDFSITLSPGDSIFLDNETHAVTGIKWTSKPQQGQFINALGQRFVPAATDHAEADVFFDRENLRPIVFTSESDFYYPIAGKLAHFRGRSSDAGGSVSDITVVLDPTSGILKQAYLAEPLSVILQNQKKVILQGRLSLDSSGNPIVAPDPN